MRLLWYLGGLNLEAEDDEIDDDEVDDVEEVEDEEEELVDDGEATEVGVSELN